MRTATEKVLNHWDLKSTDLMDGIWLYWSGVALAVQGSKL